MASSSETSTAIGSVFTTSPGRTWGCSGPTIPTRRSARWSARWASKKSTPRLRGIACCKTPRGAGPPDETIRGGPDSRRPSDRGDERVWLLQAATPGAPAFPAAWLEIIEKDVPFYRDLPDADRQELQGLVQVFLAEKHFEGCGGLELTDEIKVTIAAQACRLLLHRETDIYPRLITILVYPD